MQLDINLIWREIVPKGSALGFPHVALQRPMMSCCICSGLATSCHRRCTWGCRAMTYGEGWAAFWSFWFHIQFLALHCSCWPPCATSKAWSHRGVQGWELPGPSCVLLISQKSCRLWLTDGVRVRVCVLSLRELWLFVSPKPKEGKTQFSGHKEQKGLHYSLVCLKQTDQ